MQYFSSSRRQLFVGLALLLCAAVAAEAKPRRARAEARSHAAPYATLHPQARVRLQSAMKEMRRRGLRPHVTSAYRSRAAQRAIYACSQKRRCRARRGIYGARRPGTSLHEAGLAVDLAGVARGSRRHRRLTPRGRQMVRVMRKHGFNWRYGLKDPAHFEINPRRAGYRSGQAAINARHRRYTAKYSLRLASRRARSRRA
jgi:LAS superfamily LD-carboxypeptidase LdcB